MNTMRVRYIPIKDGDLLDLGDTAPQTTSYYATKKPHIILGYKPGPGPKAAGWLVVLVDESVKGRGAVQPHKRREPRTLKAVG
jgi:hypothetical protein